MEFKISEAEAQWLAQVETEAGSMISAGPDLGEQLGDVMRLELFGIDHDKVISLLHTELGNVFSQAEIEEVAADFQAQIRSRLMQKISAQQSV